MEPNPKPQRRVALLFHIALMLLLLDLSIGCGATRPPQTEASLMQKRDEYRQSYLDETDQRYTAVLQRNKAQLDEYQAGKRSTPPVIDYLIISGGGDYGAFGAGFLKGWSKVPKTDALARPPRFDLVTGVSTGALIAPFAWIGDAESDQRVVDLYRNPSPDWVKERWPLYFLPYHLSFVEVPGLEREIRRTYSKEMIARIADPAESGRLLFVNTTNLDDATPHVFYLVPEAHRAMETGDLSRFHNILLASAGVPAAFPYREIDGAMYVDGAVTANMIFGGRLPEERRLVGLWERLYPDVTMPKLRYWVIFNNQLHTPPIVVRPRWFDIITRSVDVASRSASLNAMRQLYMLAEVARLNHRADVEVRFVAVPDDWRPPVPGTFVKETMSNLADLGEKMGADPKSWITEPPTQ
jgi:predicted acylesterase/phospholipase RssA